MASSRKPEIPHPLGDLLLAPGWRIQRYRWLILAVAVVLQVLLVLIMRWTDSTFHPLAPLGAALVFISVLAAGLGGVFVGLVAALAGVVASFLLLADLNTEAGAANAAVSAVLWCGAAVVTGVVVTYLRGQVARRQAALEQALHRSLSARHQIERVLEFTPQFHEGETPVEVAQAICDTAVATFGSDGARLYALSGESMEIIALTPTTGQVAPGFTLSISDFPEIDEMLAHHRPMFIRDVRPTGVTGPALDLVNKLRIVSTIRIPIASPQQPVGLLGLNWSHPIEPPSDELMVIMQRFADHAGIAWQNALRLEARRQADTLHETLERLVTLAPTFHITGTVKEVAQAICEAAVMTFECKGATLYRVEGDRITVLDRVPQLASLQPGRTFPLRDEMPLAREIRSRTPTFIRDVHQPSRSARPWPPEVIAEVGTRSALYVPLRFDERGPQNLIIMNWDEHRDPPDAAFLVVVERFADQVALALTNASAERLHARLEASLLPTTPVDHPLVEVITRYRTGEQRLRLGGDFVGSTIVGDNDLRFIIGDVSGHGPDAAALGATLRSTWKALALAGMDVRTTVAVMRRMLLVERAQPAIFATIIAGQIDLLSRTLSFVNVGHLPPLLLAGDVMALETSPVPPLGVGKEGGFSLGSFALPEHWRLFFYTDGLIDIRVAPGSSERYGEDRLKARLGTWLGCHAEGEALDVLMNEIETASGSRFADDVAIMLICAQNARDR